MKINVLCEESERRERAKFRYRDRIGEGRFRVRTHEDMCTVGESCGELAFTIKFRYRQLIN